MNGILHNLKRKYFRVLGKRKSSALQKKYGITKPLANFLVPENHKNKVFLPIISSMKKMINNEYNANGVIKEDDAKDLERLIRTCHTMYQGEFVDVSIATMVRLIDYINSDSNLGIQYYIDTVDSVFDLVLKNEKSQSQHLKFNQKVKMALYYMDQVQKRMAQCKEESGFIPPVELIMVLLDDYEVEEKLRTYT